METAPTSPKWEVADVIKSFSHQYLSKQFIPYDHKKVMRNIVNCRTSAMGGHLEKCNSCKHQRPTYNSCRDRHCPKCQTMKKEQWLAERKKELLPVNYFHKVFTLPHELNKLVLQNKRLLLNFLFKSVSETLLQFGKDPRSKLCAKVGFTLILHTWNQQLLDHFHIHCVIPNGGLSEDAKKWIKGKNDKFLFSVKALGIVFKAKFLELLDESYRNGTLRFNASLSDLQHPKSFEFFLEKLKSINWIVYSKVPFGGPEKTLNYLGRYTHKVAISNHRIKEVNNKNVVFSYQDRETNTKKNLTLLGTEFLRRFLLHVLPKGLIRIRHFGFLASRSKQKELEACRATLNIEKTEDPKKNLIDLILDLTGVDIHKCPKCSTGKMKRVEKLCCEVGFQFNSS